MHLAWYSPGEDSSGVFPTSIARRSVRSSKSTDFGGATVSSKRSEPLDLERDLPTTAEDVAALRRIRDSRRISFADYLRFLSRLELPAAARRRKTHEGQEPFEL
jgi:hypothetical protein